MNYSLAQIKAIIITPAISGSMSTIASGSLIATILNSDTKLSVPSKRILFGLCVHDSLMSLSVALSSLPIPKGQGMWGAVGNVQSCDFQGFIMHIGYVGSIMYNCNLSIYYLCVIRFSMSDATFQKKIEPFCHLIPNSYSLGGAIYLLSKGYFNSIGNMCWIGPYPIDCINNSDVECLRGDDHAYLFRWIFLGYAVCAVWAVIIITMLSIVFMVVMQRRKSERWASGGGEHRGRSRSLIKKDCLEHQAAATPAKNPAQLMRGSSKSMKECKDPLVFDLKAMRAKTKNQSLILKTSESLIGKNDAAADSPADNKYSDPHPFDVKTARAAKRTSLRSLTKKKAFRKSVNHTRSSLGPTHQPTKITKISFDDTTKKDDVPSTHHLRRSSRCSSGRRSTVSQYSQTKRGPCITESFREAQKQALLYIFSFMFCWVFPVINRMLEERGKELPFIIFELGRVFNPIQGLFNVLIYTRPHVRGLRTNHPEYSWWKAFYLTVKSGGDNNAPRGDKASIRSRKSKEKLLERIRQNHIERMSSIRQQRESYTQRLRGSSSSDHIPNVIITEKNDVVEETKESSRVDLNIVACTGTNGNDDHDVEDNIGTDAAAIPKAHDYSPCNADDGEKDLEQGYFLVPTKSEK